MSLRRLYDLGEHPIGRSRVHKGDAGVTNPDPRLGIDQVDAGFLELAEHTLDVIDRVGDVVEPGALALEVPADRCVGTEGPQQLHVPLADVEQHRLDALALDGLTMGYGHSHRPLVEGDRP